MSGAALALALALLAAPVATGLDALVEGGFAPLQGKRVGIVTNHTGLDREGRRAVDLLHAARGVTLVAIFSPEHGLAGAADARVASGRDERTGLQVHSLYGETKRPTRAMLAPLDALVFDIQDVGARFYTYITTLGLCLEAAAEEGKEVIVLDRPNAIGGAAVEGPVLEAGLRGGFASYFALPTRHGMTVGEIARWHAGERGLRVRLTVVPVRGWSRAQHLDETGLRWIDPSPNMRSVAAAIHYPGLGALEATNLSVGRGTETPFEVYGAPWIDAPRLVADLERRRLPGVRFREARFTPRPIPGRPRYPHTGEECRGFAPEITDRVAYRPVRTALHVAAALHALHGDRFEMRGFAAMIGRRDIEARIRAGTPPEEIEAGWSRDLDAFLEARARHLIYSE